MSKPDDSESDDDYGPVPVAPPADETAEAAEAEVEDIPKKKKAKKLDFEELYLDNLPSSSYYEHSFMHRDVVTHVAVSKKTEFIITASMDGHVKFWKKMNDNIEFVKHFQAHLGRINAFVVSPDEKMLLTTSEDKAIKFFEIVGFDMTNMIMLDYVPTCASWVVGVRNISDKVAVADSAIGTIRIYKADSNKAALHELSIHSSPVRCMSLNVEARTIVSIDSKGVIEYWSIDSYEMPSKEISFQYKSETDLYELAKAKAIPCCIVFSPNSLNFATFSLDKKIRIFDFRRGKLLKVYDESVKVYAAMNSNNAVGMDNIEYGRRQAIERELEASTESLAMCNLVYDESGNFLVFGSLKGIKIINTVNNVVSRIIGSGESGERFLWVALYQGIPKVDNQFLLSKAGAQAGVAKTVDQLSTELLPDPTIYATSFKRRRFYCFSTRNPDESKEPRDVLNELPTEDEKHGGNSNSASSGVTAKAAVLRTNFGDIQMKLYADECPRTVENFTTHIKNGYYNNLIFHRVIKGFMVQTGDPLGNGTGGESIWGHEFEDEFVKSLKHDRPYTLSMANAGPNTNGSQFFITTVPTPWLDNKHTVFGRVTKGFEVVTKIENVKVNKVDKPYEDVRIMSAELL